MKIYKVKVNGKIYEVELESVTESKEGIKQETKEVKTEVQSGEGTPLLSPIQGTILKINVSVGDSVKKGDNLLIIEAMKLENEIVAPKDGVIKAIKVSKGQNVNSKELLLLIG